MNQCSWQGRWRRRRLGGESALAVPPASSSGQRAGSDEVPPSLSIWAATRLKSAVGVSAASSALPEAQFDVVAVELVGDGALVGKLAESLRPRGGTSSCSGATSGPCAERRPQPRCSSSSCRSRVVDGTKEELGRLVGRLLADHWACCPSSSGSVHPLRSTCGRSVIASSFGAGEVFVKCVHHGLTRGCEEHDAPGRTSPEGRDEAPADRRRCRRAWMTSGTRNFGWIVADALAWLVAGIAGIRRAPPLT